MQHDYLVAIDIGSTKICTLVATYDGEKISVVGVGNVPAQGIRRGVVVNLEDTISSLSSSLEEAERMAGYSIESAFVSIGGGHISSLNSRGVIAVSRADGEITQEDVGRVIEAAQAISLPMNREILHVLPRGFILDGQEGVENPAGMTGVRLEVEAHIVNTASSAIRNLSKCVQQTGVEVEEIVMSSMATAEAVLNSDDKELGVAILDIGGGTTDISIFVEGSIVHSSVIPIGSNHITNDIAIGLRIPFDVAENVKQKALNNHHYARLDPTTGESLTEDIPQANHDIVNLSDYGLNKEVLISSMDIYEIIEARLSELFDLTKEEINKAGQEGLLAGGIVMSGGGAMLSGIEEIAKEQLHLPVRVGLPKQMLGIADGIRSPLYSVAIGLLLWGVKSREHQETSRTSPVHVWFNVFTRFKDWIKKSFFP